jgi:hypothetical protein
MSAASRVIEEILCRHWKTAVFLLLLQVLPLAAAATLLVLAAVAFAAAAATKLGLVVRV